MIRRLVNWLTILTFLVTSSGVVIFFLFFYYGRGLPDYDFLHHYEPVALNSIAATDGQILREFALERRIYTPLHKIPAPVIHSFLVAEDKHFYYHCGLDVPGILRAIIANSTRGAWHSRPLGGSTITQQVAKNFLIGNECSLDRKVREAIMSLRLEAALTKERILDLYLNQIYLGMGAYGVTAAALVYFNKSLNELSVAETAFLAAMPKAPSFYPNQKDLSRAITRRNWVLDRLEEEGFLTEAQTVQAKAEALKIRPDGKEKSRPNYYTEHIRQELVNRFGHPFVIQGGLTIKTTLDPSLQALAQKAMQQGLIAYDRRHGWRGPLDHKNLASLRLASSFDNRWQELLEKVVPPPGLGNWSLAIVLDITPEEAKIGLKGGGKGSLSLAHLAWARKNLPNQMTGPAITHPGEVLAPGDIVAVSRNADHLYELEQIPEVTGGLVALNPHTGHILAMVGGYDFEKSQYNCATQAQRQPGSAFKPFVYLTALEHGYTPETRVLDAPVMVSMGGKRGIYMPKNADHKYYGPTSLRSGLIHSRNVMTVRLAQQIGLRKIGKTAKAFGLVENLPNQLAMALGAAETTLLQLTVAYGMIANGGFFITPVFIEEIKDRYNEVIYKNHTLDKIPVASSKSVDQLTQMLEGVVLRGTACSLATLRHPLAGKTGTTNEYKDGWFIGFTRDLVVGVFVGFPSPRTLGAKETGARVALPVFRHFMEKALEGKPPVPFRQNP